VKSRQQPVENLDIGHHVSTVAHLGNLALQSGNKIKWDGNEDIGRPYRAPWKL
jgi:hypothetical protein